MSILHYFLDYTVVQPSPSLVVACLAMALVAVSCEAVVAVVVVAVVAAWVAP